MQSIIMVPNLIFVGKNCLALFTIILTIVMDVVKFLN